MEYKLIAVDLDGTLLGSDRKVSDRNRRAMQDVLSAGKIFTVSTGRPLQGVLGIIDMLDADLPFIIYNGAMALTTKSRRVIYETSLSGELAREAVILGRELGTTLLIWARGELYVSEFNQSVKDYMEIVNYMPKVVDNLEQIAANGVTKVIWRDEPERMAKFQDEIKSRFAGRLNCHLSLPILLEFVDINASKAVAMQKIGEHYEIAQSEMIAVGDSFNDISMIEYARLGVAMGNAPEPIKNIADYVTLSNDEDGVAHVINRFML